MRTIVYISKKVPPHAQAMVDEVFRRIGVEPTIWVLPYHAGDALYDTSLDETDPRLPILLESFNALNLKPFVRREAVFTTADLKAAPLLELSVNRAPKGDAGICHGTLYDMSMACRRCGTGARQTSALRIKPPSALPKKAMIAQTYMGHVLIAASVATAIRNQVGDTGALRQVEAFGKERGQLLPWYQILPEHTMPPMAPETMGVICGTGDEEPCPDCGRDGRFHAGEEPFLPAYRVSDLDRALDELPDFVSTWECFHKSRLGDVLALPQVLISNRVMRVLRNQKVRGAHLTPVRFVE
jgi:hypothetical protein